VARNNLAAKVEEVEAGKAGRKQSLVIGTALHVMTCSFKETRLAGVAALRIQAPEEAVATTEADMEEVR